MYVGYTTSRVLPLGSSPPLLLSPLTAPPDRSARAAADVGFDRAVYVLSVRVFECYHPGGVVRLWARWAEGDRPRWALLWRRRGRRDGDGDGDGCQPFSPPLRILRRPVRCVGIGHGGVGNWSTAGKMEQEKISLS